MQSVDAFDSSASDKALSAGKGKELKEDVNSLNERKVPYANISSIEYMSLAKDGTVSHIVAPKDAYYAVISDNSTAAETCSCYIQNNAGAIISANYAPSMAWAHATTDLIYLKQGTSFNCAGRGNNVRVMIIDAIN